MSDGIECRGADAGFLTISEVLGHVDVLLERGEVMVLDASEPIRCLRA